MRVIMYITIFVKGENFIPEVYLTPEIQMVLSCYCEIVGGTHCKPDFLISRDLIADLHIALACECENCTTYKDRITLTEMLERRIGERGFLVMGVLNTCAHAKVYKMIEYLEEGVPLQLAADLIYNIFD